MVASVYVFVTEFQVHHVPQELYDTAMKLNERSGRRLSDRRTLGYRHLKAWADKKDQKWIANWLAQDD